jgi:soluble lytic murein transglycosylase
MGTEDRLARARRLRELKRPAAAEAELRAIEEKLPPDEAREVALSIARCVYAKRRAWAEAQALFEPLAKGGDAIAAESAYMVARCLHKRGRNEQAAAAYRRFLDRFKGSSLRDDAYMNLMVIDYEAGRFPAVRKNNLPLLRAGVWAGGDRGSALWMIAFSAYLEGELDEARELMDDYAAQATSEMSRLRSTYWGAVVRQEAGDGDAAARRYLEIASGHPLHYYALLSMRRLRDMDRELPDVDGIVGPPPAPAEAGCDELPPVVRALSGLGMHYHARREMSRHAAALVEEHVDEPAALVDIFGCAHAEKLLIRHAGAVEDEHEGGAATRVRWTLLYPTPYRDLVEEHAGESGVPPLLAMAVIRQESMFDPDATSVVRASGLMQLMPATARQVAGELDVSYDEDLLFDPETNITFGTHYLGGLIDRFPGNLPAAVAAYNGGPHNVSRWLASHAPVAGDVFVELVPFSQTRNYVRRVLTSYARYTYLETGSYERALGWVGRRMTGELGRGPDY